MARAPDRHSMTLLGVVVGAAIAAGSFGFAFAMHGGPLLSTPVSQPRVEPAQQPQTEASVAVEKNRRATLVAIGDVMLSRAVARKMKRHGIDYPFEETREFLQSADVLFGNLEHPITTGGEILDNELKLRANPDAVTALSNAGFTVMSIANNHVPDFGEKGVVDTIRFLDDAGIGHAGAGATLEDAQENSIPIQLERLHEFERNNNLDIIHVEKDEGQSGLTADRPGFQRLLNDWVMHSERSQQF